MNDLEPRDLTHREPDTADMASIMLGMKRPLLTSLDIDTERGKLLYSLAMGDPDYKGKLAVGKEFAVTDFLFHTYRVEDEKTGDVEIRPRLCIFTADDKCWGIGGQICIESFLNLTVIWGKPPWQPGKKVVVIEAGRGYKMIPVREALESPAPKGKRKDAET